MAVPNQKLKELAATFRAITESFQTFTCEIIGLKNAQFQKELDDILSLEHNRKIAVTLPRGHGKSTHLAVSYPLWEMAKNHNVRILLVSNTAEISRTSLSAIKNNVEKNERYRYWAQAIDPKGKGVLPQLRPKHKREEHWSADSITISRSNIQIKDPSVVAVGLFGSILSRRADIIICDDICNQENSLTEEQRAKVTDWVHTTLMPVLVPGGRFIYIGNTWHMDDLMSSMLHDPQFDVKKRMPAILHEATCQDLWEEWSNILLNESIPPEEKKKKADDFYNLRKAEMDLGVEVLWPEMHSYKKLYLDRISDPYSFARMYQCDPSIRPNQKFSEKDIEVALAKGKDMILEDAVRTEYETEMTTGGLDMAVSLQTWSDDTVLLLLDKVRYGTSDGVIKDGDYVIRNIKRGKFSPEEIRKMVAENEVTVRPLATRVETNGAQHMMYTDLSDSGAMVTSYHTGGEKNDPAIGVYSLAILFEQHKIILPNSPKDARTRRLIAQLVNEMRSFPDGHTGDSLMAFWFAFSEMRDRMNMRVIFPQTPSNIIKDYIPAEAAKTKELDEWLADRELELHQDKIDLARWFVCQDVVRDVKLFGVPFAIAMRRLGVIDAKEEALKQEQEKHKHSFKEMVEIFGKKKD